MSSSIMGCIFGTLPQPRAQPVTVIQTSTTTTATIFTGSTGIPLARSTQSTTPTPSFSFPTSSSTPASPSVSPSESLITVTTTSLITSAVVTHTPVSPVILPPRHGALLGAAIVGAVIGGIVVLFLPLLLWNLLKKRPKRDVPPSPTDTDEKLYKLFQSRASITTLPVYLPQMDNVTKQGLMNDTNRRGPVGSRETTFPLEILRGLRTRAELQEEPWRRGYSEQWMVREDVEASQNIVSDRNSYSWTMSTLPLYHE